MLRIIKNSEKYLIFATAALFVVFVLPKFASPYIVPKEIFGAVMVALVLILWSVRAVVKGEASFSIGKFDLGVALIALAYIISAVVRTPNKMEAFFFPGTATFVIISVLFYFLINQFDKKTKNFVLVSLFVSGILLSVSILFTQIGLFAKIPQLPVFIKDSSFNPVGGALPSTIYLLCILIVGLVQIIKNRDLVKRIFFTAASLVVTLALVLLVINLLPGKPSSILLPTMQTSWEVTVESLKQSPIWGVGPSNYLTAFNLFRPVSYNQTGLWMARFSSANNFYLTLITETGFAGLAALVILLAGIYKTFSEDLKKKDFDVIPVVVLLIAFLIFPGTPVLFFLLAAILAVFSKSEEKTIILANTRVPAAIIALPILVGLVLLAVFGTKAATAEVIYKKSLNALTNNDAKETYNLMAASAVKNPYVDRYHASLAQIDMALATSIASQKNLTDADRTTITQLVQQAINEGKATVTLNPARSGNWEILAQIYRSIMAFAQGSDQFAVQTYTQAVALDPTNPNLRIALGGTFYALGRYDEAIDAFKLAVLTKPDLANAHYNLSIAYREKKDFDNAITEMKNVLALVKKDSPDYTLAQTTLSDLEKNKPSSKITGGTELTAPQAVAPTNVKPPITLPSEATPPAANQ